MDSMYSHDFDRIVNAASSLQRPARVALAGADVENILLGLFDAQEAGFAEPVLIGNYQKIMDKLKALGLENRSFDLQPARQYSDQRFPAAHRQQIQPPA